MVSIAVVMTSFICAGLWLAESQLQLASRVQALDFLSYEGPMKIIGFLLLKLEHVLTDLYLLEE